MRSSAPGQLGQGVEYKSISRIREQFLDDQFRNENKALGSWSIRQDTLEKIEAIINEPSETGIRTVIDKFWKAWSDFSKDPENIDGRKIVRESAMTLADGFNDVSRRLTDLSADLTENIQVKANQINTITQAVAKLNSEIQRVEGLGDNANDLRDQRDLLVDDLSKIVNIDVIETETGYDILMGGISLVAGHTFTDVDSGILESALASGDLTAGEVHGMLLSRDQFVTSYLKELDIMANTIANGKVTITIPAGSVLPDNTTIGGVTYTGAARTLTSDLTVEVDGLNGLHQLGYNFENTDGAPVFFTSKDGGPITAANMQLNVDIQNNANLIASSLRTSGTPESVVRGNNTAALLLSQLRDSKYTFDLGGGTTTSNTVDDYFRSVIGQLGIQANEANRQTTNQQMLVEQVDARRLSVSGVSLDEEMTNMIKFQHAYNAAARAMTTFDEMLDKVINSMGVVGR